MENDNLFWEYIENIVKNNEIVIDRPKGTSHPKYGNMVYDVDYGYIKNTKSADGGGIDVFVGSNNNVIDAIICVIDLLKNDSEIKILIGCTDDEKNKVNAFLNNSEYMKAIMVKRNNFSKNISVIKNSVPFDEIYDVFQDVVYTASRENVRVILAEYDNDKNKVLYGFFTDKKLIGIIGINSCKEGIEIRHFGILKEYRNKKYGKELMNFIVQKYREENIFLYTDDDAIGFYKKYGYKAAELLVEKDGKKYKRYKCEYNRVLP